MSALSEAAIAGIFTAATTATNWTRTNLGLRTEVAYDGSTWTVQLPPESGRAYIAGSNSWGGSTCEYIEATWSQTFALVEAALAATRVH